MESEFLNGPNKVNLKKKQTEDICRETRHTCTLLCRHAEGFSPRELEAVSFIPDQNTSVEN